MKALCIALCTLCISGCSTVGKFDNVIVTTLTGDRAFVSSLYGPIGITAELRKDDARELQVMREKARMLDLLVRATSGPGL